MRNVETIRDQNKAKLTALAQLIELYAEAKGITATQELARLTGYSDRAIRKAKTELECRNPGAAPGTPVPEPEFRPEPQCRPTRNPSADPEPGCRNPGSDPSRVECNNKLTTLVDTPVDSKNPLPPTKTKLGKLDALRAFEAYNAVALQCGLPQASKLTPDRERKIVARLKDFGADGWGRALANIEKSSFLTGSNDRGFRADLDFLLQPKSFARVHDGGYGNGRHAKISAFKISPRAETEFEREARIQAEAERMFG
jgi:hypothetical protein